MEKLSKSMASKRYLEKKYGKSQPISDEMQKQLKQAGTVANEKIRLNNTIYMQSNSHSHETIVQEKISNQISEVEQIMNNFMEKAQGPKLIKNIRH